MAERRGVDIPSSSTVSDEEQEQAQEHSAIKDENVGQVSANLEPGPQDTKDGEPAEAKLSDSGDRCEHCGQLRNACERNVDDVAGPSRAEQQEPKEEVRRLRNELNKVRHELYEVFEYFMAWWHDWGWSDEPSRVSMYELVDSFRVASTLWRDEHHFDSLIAGMLQW
ncbi:hypothetical protein NDA16_002197 [Ustilago loliicola]|nr:hypothetical protein NDA16_002197 [Ustilago loliicola]